MNTPIRTTSRGDTDTPCDHTWVRDEYNGDYCVWCHAPRPDAQMVAGPRCNAKNPPCEECVSGHA